MPHHDHPEGLAHDLNTLQKRRRALLWLAGAAGVASAPLLACGGGRATSSTPANTGISTGTSAGITSNDSSACAVIPEETAGPFPGDGSNSTDSGVANALMLAGIERSDIRGSFAGATGVAAGMALTVTLRLVNTVSNCSDLSGYAIYLWHCDAAGRYSMYSDGVSAENYLRGLQVTDSLGRATFTTVFPGCYPGRMPHIHFEVYRNLATATGSANQLKTSQLAFPVTTCQEVYATSGYGASVANLAQMSFADDNVFSDGTSLQMGAMTGNKSIGYAAALTVGIAA
jgi:protocatechuate 3,4-dioxygenase beta subunit